MKGLLKKSLLPGLVLTMSAYTNIEAQEKPNIVLIMADDLGWGDTGYNGNTIIKTPNLDKMAGEGVRFDRFYSASAVCSPTRASVLTGRNPFRTGVFHANRGVLRTEEVTIPELLKTEGYTTGHFGKWHLGTLTTEEKDANRGKLGNTEEYNPPKWHGYDQAFVTESKVPTYDPMKKPIVGAEKKGWDYIKSENLSTAHGTAYWDIDGKKMTDNLEGDDSRVIMDRVLPFIDKSKANDKPFLAVVWFHTPHMPCVAGPKYQQMYKDQDSDMRNYAGCITAMDDQIGRLRAHLNQLGIGENTMIWFCSDNGPEKGNPGITGGFKARKRSFYEGGIRVPGLLVWPEKIKKPFVTDVPCVTSDYLPTIIEALNIDKSEALNKLDGLSLLPLFEGKTPQRKSPIGFAIKEQIAFVDGKYKLYARKGKFELYDISSDPKERVDIASIKKSLVKRMSHDYKKWLISCKASFMGEEYGKESFNKLHQEWVDPLVPTK